MNSLTSLNRHVPVTFLAVVYNEEHRIRALLEQACCWADEVVIADKGSTDGTCAICHEYGDVVRVISIPFSPKGHEDVIAIAKIPKNDWIFFGTASEIPTFNLVQKALLFLEETGGALDLIYVPRRIYSFGVHSERSPWSIFYYPFLINRTRAMICNTIHENFAPNTLHATRKIPYSEDCCVYHFTHPTAKQYLADMMQYFEAEVQSCKDPAAKMRECHRQISIYKRRLRNPHDELFGLYCAWLIYWLGTALYVWEKNRELDVPKHYDWLREQVIEREWLKRNKSDSTTNDCPDALWGHLQASKKEESLLIRLTGRKICRGIKVLYVIGAHEFQEKDLLFRLFPKLEKVYLFEPLPQCVEHLKNFARQDKRIEVFETAIGDQDGETEFHITDNYAASSSLLPLGNHREYFPHVHEVGCIKVTCQTLGTAITRYNLRIPDMLFIDVQGAEYQVLSVLTPEVRNNLKILYTEASTRPLYIGGRTLRELAHMLGAQFRFLGFMPLAREVPVHGNALFVGLRSLSRLSGGRIMRSKMAAKEQVTNFLGKVIRRLQRYFL